ncbi:MAG: hypothetical protein KDK71_06310 [Chlamydiia bacterium]|nr:hypothetical protein [Chlamydiia bacterium]
MSLITHVDSKSTTTHQPQPQNPLDEKVSDVVNLKKRKSVTFTEDQPKIKTYKLTTEEKKEKIECYNEVKKLIKAHPGLSIASKSLAPFFMKCGTSEERLHLQEFLEFSDEELEKHSDIIFTIFPNEVCQDLVEKINTRKIPATHLIEAAIHALSFYGLSIVKEGNRFVTYKKELQREGLERCCTNIKKLLDAVSPENKTLTRFARILAPKHIKNLEL